MQKLNYPLKKYQKAVEKLAIQNGLSRVRVVPNKGSAIRFELFEANADTPFTMWVIHHSHTKRKEVWSKENYRKAAVHLNCTLEKFIETIESL